MELHYLLSDQLLDHHETLHVNGVDHEHENGQGTMSIVAF